MDRRVEVPRWVEVRPGTVRLGVVATVRLPAAGLPATALRLAAASVLPLEASALLRAASAPPAVPRA